MTSKGPQLKIIKENKDLIELKILKRKNKHTQEKYPDFDTFDKNKKFMAIKGKLLLMTSYLAITCLKYSVLHEQQLRIFLSYLPQKQKNICFIQKYTMAKRVSQNMN